MRNISITHVITMLRHVHLVSLWARNVSFNVKAATSSVLATTFGQHRANSTLLISYMPDGILQMCLLVKVIYPHKL